MKKLTILVDQDGVLADYQSKLLALFEKEHPGKFSIPTHLVTEHDVEKLFPEMYRPQLRAISLRAGFFRSLPPISGGKEALEAMLAMGHDVRICTAPMKLHTNCVAEKYDWVLTHLGQHWVERMVVTRDKTLIHGDILIDDKPEITGVCTPLWQHVLYDQPYNQNSDQPRLTWANYQKVLSLWE